MIVCQAKKQFRNRVILLERSLFRLASSENRKKYWSDARMKCHVQCSSTIYVLAAIIFQNWSHGGRERVLGGWTWH
jgi:hypothetical protein